MTNTARINYRKAPKPSGPVRLVPGRTEVWITGPLAGQPVAVPTISYVRKGR